MALTETQISSYKVLEGFNDIFSEIVNNELRQPTFDAGFTNKWQFLEKRPGWLKLFDMAAEIIDYWKSGEKYYVLEKIDATTCKLWKVAKDPVGAYTLKTNLTPVNGLSYDPQYNRGVCQISYPDVSSVKVTNSTPTNVVDPTDNPYGDYSDTLKDTTKTFDNSYFNIYGVITSHSEAAVLSVTLVNPPGSPTIGDRYIIPAAATGVWAGKTGQITQYTATGWVFTLPTTGYFAYNKGDSKTYRCVETAGPVYTWSICAIDNGWKEGTRFEVQAVLDGNTLRIVSPVTINNFDSYSIYGVLSQYSVFKKSGSTTGGKIGVNPLNDSVQVFTSLTNTRDMEIFDGYLFGCSQNRVFQKGVGQESNKTSQSNFYFYDSDLYSIESTGDFLLIGGNNKCYGLLRLSQTTTGDFTYKSRELTQLGLWSKKSILTYGGSVYVLLSDKRWYGLNVTFTAQSAQVQLKDVGVKIQNYLNRLDIGDEAEGFWYNGNFGFVLNGNYNALVRYNEPYQGFIVDEYGYGFRAIELTGGVINSMYNNMLFIKGGEFDYDKEISTRVVMITPEGAVGLPQRQLLGRLLFGYAEEPVNFKVTVEMDSNVYVSTLTFDPAKTDIVQQFYGLGDGTLGSKLLGSGILGVGGSSIASRIGIIGMRIGKTCHMAKYTITNVNNSNFVFGGLDVLYQTANPMLVPIKNVI